MYCVHLRHNTSVKCVSSFAADCPSGLFRCDVTTDECILLENVCDVIVDCVNGADEDFSTCEGSALECLNGGTRVDAPPGTANTCNCTSRYTGDTCDVDQGTSVVCAADS